MDSAELERLIDAHGLEDVLRGMSKVCSCKACSDSDVSGSFVRARAWQSASEILSMIATTVRMMQLSSDQEGTGIPD